jgi:pyrroloquinoline quinone (PQQ) biosynthesis protein C
MTDSAAAVETALATEEFIAKIWQERRRFVREGRIKQPHPWQVALSQGMVSKAALIEYVKNRYYFLCNINRKDAQIIANCPIADARRLLLRKYIDEEGQDVAGGRLGPHYEMWLKISDALEIPRGIMNSFEDACRSIVIPWMLSSTLRNSMVGSKAWPQRMRPKGACGSVIRPRKSTEKRAYCTKERR